MHLLQFSGCEEALVLQLLYVGRLIALGWGTTSVKLILAHDWGERIKGRTIRQWPGDSLCRAPCVAT